MDYFEYRSARIQIFSLTTQQKKRKKEEKEKRRRLKPVLRLAWIVQYA